MRRSRYICAAVSTSVPGTPGTGTINVLDSNTFAVVKQWTAHSGGISDFDAQHDFIVACGYSLRQGANWMHDHFVSVFDLKNLTSMPPIPFPAGAAFVRMHPRMSTTSIICSQSGQMHVVDLMNVNTSNVRQIMSLSYLTMIEMAPSGEALALADSECNVQLWGSPTRIRFAEFATPIEREDYQEQSAPISWAPDM